MIRLLTVLLIALSTLSFSAYADDETGLYDPAAPEGSAFFRVLEGVEPTPYKPMQTDENMDEGQYYTALQKGEAGRIVLKDPAVNNRAKALLVFYNATTRENLSLKTSDGKISIIDGVESWQNASREINAVRIGFSIHDENEELVSIEEKVIDRGSAYAIILRESQDGEFQLGFSRAQTDTSQ